MPKHYLWKISRKYKSRKERISGSLFKDHTMYLILISRYCKKNNMTCSQKQQMIALNEYLLTYDLSKATNGTFFSSIVMINIDLVYISRICCFPLKHARSIYQYIFKCTRVIILDKWDFIAFLLFWRRCRKNICYQYIIYIVCTEFYLITLMAQDSENNHVFIKCFENINFLS